MRPLLHRLAFALATGYIFMYFSELLFWARPLAGTTLPGVIPLWLLYSLAAFVVLTLVSSLRIQTLSRTFLVGAVYGWLIEGVFAQTLYGMLPFSISFTALAWHALLAIGVGWWFLPRALSSPHLWRPLRLAGLIGVGYGVWAIGWWAQVAPSSVVAFTLYSVGATLVLIGAYGVLWRWPLATFSPSRWEYIICGMILAAFLVVVMLLLQLIAIVVLLPLMALTLFLLTRTRDEAQPLPTLAQFTPPADGGRSKLSTLLLIPAIASGIYALAWTLHVVWPTAIVAYIITMPMGFICFLLAALRVMRQPRKRHIALGADEPAGVSAASLSTGAGVAE